MGWCGPEARPEITTPGETSTMSMAGRMSTTGAGKTFFPTSKRYDLGRTNFSWILADACDDDRVKTSVRM